MVIQDTYLNYVSTDTERHRYIRIDNSSNSSFAHDVILSHWAPSWLILQITLAVYSETVVSIYYFIVRLNVLWMLILRSVAQ